MTKIFAYAQTASPPGLCALAADCAVVFNGETVDAKIAIVERKDETAVAVEIEHDWHTGDVMALAQRGELIAVPYIVDHGGLDVVEQVQLRKVDWTEQPTAWIQGAHRDDLTADMRAWQPRVILASVTGDRRMPVLVATRPEGTGERVEIVIAGNIGEGAYTADETVPLVRAAAAAGASIELVLDSDGGNVEDALALYRELVRHPFKVTATIHKALSAAAVLVMSADLRKIAPDGQMMLHAPSLDTEGANAERLIRLTHRLLDLQKEFGRIVAIGTGCDPKTADSMIAEARSFTAADAVRAGLAHEIDFAIPPSRPQAIPATWKPLDQASRLVRPAAALRLWGYGGKYRVGEITLHKGQRWAATCNTMGAVGLEPGHGPDWREC